jgi:hypothetical protein
MIINRQSYFWDSLSPLGGLTAMGLLIMASARLSYAITVTGCLIWVYGLTAFTYSILLNTVPDKFFPKNGKTILYTFFASFWSSIYIFLFWFLCPFATLEVFFIMMLVPLFCASSGVFEKLSSSSKNFSEDIVDFVTESVSHVFVLSGLLIAFSVFREPLAYCSLSLPGSYRGMIRIIHFNENSFLPVRLLISSSGALILLAYFTGLYQYSKNNIFPGARR